MREKAFYIEEISKLLSKCDIDTTKAVYVALEKLKKGDSKYGLKTQNH